MSNNSKIDLDTLKKLGKLSRIPIDKTSSNKLMEDLNKIIGFIEQLNEVDTESVNPLSSVTGHDLPISCLLYTSPSPRDKHRSRMPSSA